MKTINWIIVTLCISMATPCFGYYQIDFEKMFNQMNTEAIDLDRQMRVFMYQEASMGTRVHPRIIDSSLVKQIFPSFVEATFDAQDFHDKWSTILQNTNTLLSTEESNPSIEAFSNLLSELEASLEKINSSTMAASNVIQDLSDMGTQNIREDSLRGYEFEASAIVQSLSSKITLIYLDLAKLQRTLKDQIENPDRLTVDLDTFRRQISNAEAMTEDSRERFYGGIVIRNNKSGSFPPIFGGGGGDVAMSLTSRSEFLQ